MQHPHLEKQADLIEQALAAHGVESRVIGGVVTPGFVRYEVTMPISTRLQKVLALHDEIALLLGAPDVRVYRQDGVLVVEAPRQRPSQVRLLSLCRSLPKIPPLTAVLGIDASGAPLLLRIPSPDVAHVLVAGSTGSGKTVLLRAMLASLALFSSQSALQLVLIDPKGRGFEPLARLPHLARPVITEADAAVRLLHGLVDEMEHRDREHRSTPALIVAIDELADLRMVGGKGVEEALTRLTQRGREAGIHVIMATQRPAATVVGSLVKANLPVRLVGAVGSAEDAKVASGIARSGAERLRGRGDFLLVGRGQSLRFQAAYITETEIREAVQKLNLPVNSLTAPARRTA